MNIFRDGNVFLGYSDMNIEQNSYQSLFALANQMRERLGKHSYLLDNYLSLLFAGICEIPVSDAYEAGIRASVKYLDITMSVVDNLQPLGDRDYKIYGKAFSAADKLDIDSFSEPTTRTELLYCCMADDYFIDALNCYIETQGQYLQKILESSSICRLYDRIKNIAGEAVLEILNLKIKHSFLTATSAFIFTQGFANDLLSHLTNCDPQSNKRIFQLLIDKTGMDN